MKYTLILILSAMTTLISAQTLKYGNGNISFEDRNIETIDVILEPGVSTIKDKFEDWMDDNYDVDLDGKKLLFFDKDIMKAQDVLISEISPKKKITLLVKVDETRKGSTKLNVFAKFLDDTYLTSDEYPAEHKALRGIVYDFVAEYLPEYYMEQVEDTEEEIDDLAETREDIQNKIEENKKKIIELQDKNVELNKKLIKNKKDMKTTEKELQQDNKELNSVKKKVKKLNKK